MAISANAEPTAENSQSNGDPLSAPPPSALSTLRKNYSNQPLDDASLSTSPLQLFEEWLSQAEEAQEPEPNAMSLATVDENNRPTARMVLLKGVDERGFVWYTNFTSRKADNLRVNPYAALTFWWPSLERSVRVEGKASRVDDAESDAYFHSRPPTSRLGAWASEQSVPLANRRDIEQKWEELRTEYLDEKDQPVKPIERPPFWGGYRLVPDRVEFWKGRSARLHDRVVYELKDEDGETAPSSNNWTTVRLQP